ncbi:MAG: ATP-binding protein [Alphaproteobacteria bacterium]|nr:ATP-binding protein [Alphaproteobacteria bacterium]
MITISLAAHHHAIDLASAYIVDWCAQEGVEAYHEKRLTLIVEELIANSLAHGGTAQNGNITLDLTRKKDHVAITYIDEGKPFDPNKDLVGDDRENDLDDRRVGGLGWPLIKQLCERIEYVRHDDENHTTLIRRISSNTPI